MADGGGGHLRALLSTGVQGSHARAAGHGGWSANAASALLHLDEHEVRALWPRREREVQGLGPRHQLGSIAHPHRRLCSSSSHRWAGGVHGAWLVSRAASGSGRHAPRRQQSWHAAIHPCVRCRPSSPRCSSNAPLQSTHARSSNSLLHSTHSKPSLPMPARTHPCQARPPPCCPRCTPGKPGAPRPAQSRAPRPGHSR